MTSLAHSAQFVFDRLNNERVEAHPGAGSEDGCPVVQTRIHAYPELSREWPAGCFHAGLAHLEVMIHGAVHRLLQLIDRCALKVDFVPQVDYVPREGLDFRVVVENPCIASVLNHDSPLRISRPRFLELTDLSEVLTNPFHKAFAALLPGVRPVHRQLGVGQDEGHRGATRLVHLCTVASQELKWCQDVVSCWPLFTTRLLRGSKTALVEAAVE
jgi:hypothetical protein